MPSSASSPTSADELQALDQRLRVFQRNIEIEREQSDARTSAAPRITAGREGFALQSADGNFRVRLRGYVHSDGRFYPADSGLTDARHVHPPPCPANLRHHDVQTVRCQGHA